MRLGGRLQAAIEVLSEIDARHRPVPDALKDWGLSHRFAGSGDRAAISNLVHDALRMKLSHGFIMNGDTPANLAIATLLRQWRISPEELVSTLDGDRFAPEIPSSERLADCLARDLSQAEPHVRADIPEWLVGSFERAFGAEWEAEAQAMTARPPLDLRVNTLATNRDEVLEAFETRDVAENAMKAAREEEQAGRRQLIGELAALGVDVGTLGSDGLPIVVERAAEELRVHKAAADRKSQLEKDVEEAGKRGVQVLCLQELFNGPYFCPSQDSKWYAAAERIPEGHTTRLMQQYAKKHNMVIVVPIYEEDITGVYYNTAAVIDADGSYLGKYRKNHVSLIKSFTVPAKTMSGDELKSLRGAILGQCEAVIRSNRDIRTLAEDWADAQRAADDEIDKLN